MQPPNLVAVSPGVQVIADYDQPVFYSDNYYWRYDNGIWYRSRDYTRDWVRIDVVPDRIRTIERPETYVHFHGEAHANVDRPYVAPEVREEVVTPPPQPVEQTTTTTVVTPDPEEAHKAAKEARKDAKEQRKLDEERRKDAKEQRKLDKERRKQMEHDRD